MTVSAYEKKLTIFTPVIYITFEYTLISMWIRDISLSHEVTFPRVCLAMCLSYHVSCVCLTMWLVVPLDCVSMWLVLPSDCVIVPYGCLTMRLDNLSLSSTRLTTQLFVWIHCFWRIHAQYIPWQLQCSNFGNNEDSTTFRMDCHSRWSVWRLTTSSSYIL